MFSNNFENSATSTLLATTTLEKSMNKIKIIFLQLSGNPPTRNFELSLRKTWLFFRRKSIKKFLPTINLLFNFLINSSVVQGACALKNNLSFF